jgi:hypothetical protein
MRPHPEIIPFAKETGLAEMNNNNPVDVGNNEMISSQTNIIETPNSPSEIGSRSKSPRPETTVMRCPW